MFGHVGQRLGDHEVAGGLDGRRQPAGDLEIERYFHRRNFDQRLHSGGQAGVADDRRMNAPSQVSKLGQSLGQLLVGLAERAVRRLPPVPLQVLPQHAHSDQRGRQPLLGAVMQVSLQPPPLLVVGADDPLARGAQLFDETQGSQDQGGLPGKILQQTALVR